MSQEKRYLLPVVTAGFILTAFLAVFFLKSKVVGQEATLLVDKTSAAVQTTERERIYSSATVTKTSINLPSTFNSSAAMAQNRILKFSLNWAFGGKNQRGWHLYESLIKKLIVTEANAETPEFANALAEWQQKQGFAPTGILDNASFKKMTEMWQAQRLGRRGNYATEDVLFDAPITDFWDSERDAARLKVERETYAAYKQMLAAAAKDKSLNLKLTPTGELAPEEKFLRIISAFRSREHQAQLRKQSPNSGSAGLAVNSPHFTGHALDIYVGGEPVTTKDFNRTIQVQTPVYKWLVKNAEKFGFYPYFYEPWHWEYVPQNLRTIPAASQNIPRDIPQQ